MIAVVVRRRADAANGAPENARIDECEKCGADVLVTPETDDFLRWTPALLRCNQCAGIVYGLEE